MDVVVSRTVAARRPLVELVTVNESPAVAVDGHPVAWLEQPMVLTRAERAWWAERLAR